MNKSSIDDILAQGFTPTVPQIDEPEAPETDDYEPEEDEKEPEESGGEHDSGYDADEYSSEDAPEGSETGDIDDYGNERPAPKTYTEDEVNERINRAVRERLERFERNKPSPSEMPQQKPGQSEADWQRELMLLVDQTIDARESRKQQQEIQYREQQIQAEFEHKLGTGMQRFSDFREVVGQHEITDPMTLATRAMKDPAAFLYAAAKRAPEELARIAKIADPYAQMTEMGKLEERLKKSKAATSAPKPLSRIKEDATTPKPKKKAGDSVEDLIAAADAKRMQARRVKPPVPRRR